MEKKNSIAGNGGTQETDNPVPSLDNKCLTSFLKDLIHQLGLNTAHDYDGLESDEDIILYQNAVKRRIERLQNGVETDNGQPKEIEELKRAFNSAIKSVDVNKIKKVNAHYYSTDNWLEEQCTPTYPTITVHRSGIGNTISLNGKDVTDDSIDW